MVKELYSDFPSNQDTQSILLYNLQSLNYSPSFTHHSTLSIYKANPVFYGHKSVI